MGQNEGISPSHRYITNSKGSSIQDATHWWILSGALVGVELLSVTFYLLMLALGFAAGALAAHTGWNFSSQLVTAAVVGSTAVLASYLFKRRHTPEGPGHGMPSLQMDIGEVLQIESWLPDGSAKVHYRGAQWAVVLKDGEEPPSAGAHRIVELQGSRLVVEKIQTH